MLVTVATVCFLLFIVCSFASTSIAKHLAIFVHSRYL